MIPRVLRLKNFMCYRDEATLDFTGINVACISGDNGAGKSALLDGITWALWGKGRGGSADELMSIGATDMEVDFEFDLGVERFRVRRQRRRKASLLELQVGPATTEDGPVAWRAITGDNLASTQALLTKTVGMDYVTFINSAFVLQGRADEFTTSRPADRKQLLADILGLGRYDDLEALARERRRTSEIARRDADRDIERIEAELAQGGGKQEELARLSAALIQVDAELERVTQDLALLRSRRAEQELRASMADEARRRVAQIDLELMRIDTRIARDRSALDAAAELISTGDSIRQLHQELLAAEAIEGDLNARGREHRRLAAEERELERAIESAAQFQQRQLHAIEQDLRRLRAECEQRPAIEARQRSLAQQVTAVNEAAEREGALAKELQELDATIRERSSVMELLKQQMDVIKARQAQIAEATASCPTCRRPLGDAERERIQSEYQQEGERLAADYRDARRMKQGAMERAREIEAQRGQLAPVVKRQTLLDREAGQLEHHLAETERAATLLTSRLEEFGALTKAVERGEFAPEERRKLEARQHALSLLGWDEQAYAAARDRVAALMPQRAKYEALAQATAAIESIEARVNEELSIRSERINERANEAARETELRASTADLPALVERAELVQGEQGQLSRQVSDLTRQHGAVLALVTRLADLEVAARDLGVERKRLAGDEAAYRQLADAFGKRGIQAMIIERAIPEVQDEANAILANMPGSTMRVEFRTQRETQKGALVESLDVRIGDEAGERDYSMYSGGEAFRVNFAIRVALSKLLTRRAGAKLQTLVIDEGFGTQDERGRDGIVEAIRAVERDFATILIITHINDLKDVFPRQIAIDKTAQGSRIRVL